MFPVPTIRNTSLGLAACLVGAIAFGGCAASAEEIRTARTSGYKTDFAIVYSNVLQVVRGRYPGFRENASAGTIKTAWHPIRITHQGTGGQNNQSGQDLATSSNAQSSAIASANVQRRRYFIRFDIFVVGGKPWRVRIHGYASEWELGAVPTVLQGANIPTWLKGRTDALYVELHKRLAKHAVKLKTIISSSDPKRRKVAPPKPIDLAKFGKIPAPAARVVHDALKAAKSRDFNKLRKQMADEFTWNLGATPSAKAALITWQADARVLERMVRVLEGGCAPDTASKNKVICRTAKGDAETKAYTAGFGVVDGKWKMTSFASGD